MKKTTNRWVMVIFGLLILIFAGMIYSWSVLSRHIAAEYPGWTSAQLSLTFTFLMVSFCTGQVVCGLLAGKLQPRVLVLLGAALLLGGFLIAANMHSVAMLVLGFGAMCGLGTGLAYNGVMSSVTKWFPDKQGLISGVLLMGFGFSGFIVGKVFQALTPETIGAWRTSFVVMGVLTAAALVIGSFFVKRPDAVSSPIAADIKPAGRELNTAGMLKTPDFWIYYVWGLVISAAGLALIAHGSGVALSVNGELTAGTVATFVGLISIANGAGRVIVGVVYDRLGRKAAMQSINISYLAAVLCLVLATMNGSTVLLAAGFVLTGFGYGGNPVCNSAFINAKFGASHFAVNFPVVNTSLLLASVVSTISGALYDSAGSYMSVFILMGGLAAAGLVCALLLSALERKTKN